MSALGRTSREQVVTRRDPIATTLQALELTNGGTLDARLKQGRDPLARPRRPRPRGPRPPALPGRPRPRPHARRAGRRPRAGRLARHARRGPGPPLGRRHAARIPVDRMTTAVTGRDGRTRCPHRTIAIRDLPSTRPETAEAIHAPTRRDFLKTAGAASLARWHARPPAAPGRRHRPQAGRGEGRRRDRPLDGRRDGPRRDLRPQAAHAVRGRG